MKNTRSVDQIDVGVLDVYTVRLFKYGNFGCCGD